MISDDDVMRLFEQADPARRPDRANHHVTGAGYLTALQQQKSIDMTITESPQTAAQSPRPSRWALVGAAAAVAALVIGLVAVVAQDDEPPAPADPPPPAPTAQPSEVDIAEQFYAALNDRDLATLQTLMGSDAVYEGIPVEDMPAHLAALEAWDWTWEDVACAPQSVEADVRCEIATRNRLTELTGTELAGDSLLTMTDGKIERVLLGLDFSDYSPNAFMPFTTWLQDNHPDNYMTIFEGQNDTFRQTTESAALLDQHLTEYVDEVRSEPERGRPTVTPLLSGQPQQTTVGDITWTRIEGTSLPTRVFAGVDGGFIGLGPLDDAGTVWRSPDGIEWEELNGPRDPDEELFVDDTEEPTPADPPPSAAPEHQYVVFDGGLMAVSAVFNESGESAARLELWTQAAGTDTWEPVEVPVPSGALLDSWWLSSNGSQVLFSIVSSDSRGDGPQRYEAWSTADGNTWEVVDLDDSDGLVYWPPESTDFGWMAYEPDARPRGIAVSADGLTWQKIPYSDLTDSMPGAMSILATAAGRTIFAISADSRVMLVGQLADQ